MAAASGIPGAPRRSPITTLIDNTVSGRRPPLQDREYNYAPGRGGDAVGTNIGYGLELPTQKQGWENE
jgi:hypothetical protein